MCELRRYDEEVSKTEGICGGCFPLISYHDWRELYCLWEYTQAFHCFPKDAEKCGKWLKELGLSENQVKSHSRVFSRHFCDGDPQNGPGMAVGKIFASPMLKDVPRSCVWAY